MCPDKELISAFYDNETGDKWSSNIKSHIESCGDCSAEQEKLKKISVLLSHTIVPDEDIIKQRVYSAIERRRNVIYPWTFWKKNIEVSLPAVVGAAALITILFAAFVVGMKQVSAPVVVEEIREAPANVSLQVISMEDAAAYILSDDSGFDLLITIPASEAWAVTGEPQLIREADYKRSQLNQ